MKNEISDFLDGDREQADFRRLSEWIGADESNVAAFVDQLQVEEDLRRLGLHDDVGRFVDAKKHALVRDGSAVEPSSKGFPWSLRFGPAIFAIACTLLLGFLIANVWEPPRAVEIAAGAKNEADGEAAIVATLGDTQDCVWDAETYASGAHFAAGKTLGLLSGIAQLTFETGAVLVLQGPCEIDLHENAIGLNDGRISATVPRSASGFAVTTPSSEVIDLGTEFGVSFDESDGTQVHVFSGEVVARARNDRGEIVGEPMFIRTSDAIHFRPDTDDAERFEADEKAFVRWLADRTGPVAETPPPVSGKLSIWLTSNQWLLDQEGKVNVWRDAVSVWNHMPDNALQANPQARPKVVENAIGGLPAVRFDGVDDCLITTPTTNSDSQTIALVASVSEGGREDAQIVNYNGPPQILTSNRQDPNILQIIASVDEQRNARLLPFVYLGHVGEQSIRVGDPDQGGPAADTELLPTAGEPFVAVYVYDRERNHSELRINNRTIGKTTAPATIGLTSRKVIGRHGGYAYYFKGDLAEVLIYDEGLDAERIEVLSKRLGAKYGIEQ